MTIALIDADIILYKSAFQAEYTTCEFEDGTLVRGTRAASKVARETGMTYRCYKTLDTIDKSLGIANKIISNILNKTEATDMRLYVSGRENHRYDLYPEYKQNREGQQKPSYLGVVRSYLEDRYPVIQCSGEADDAIGLDSLEGIICTIDKDLDQLPGIHYNWDKDYLYEVTEEEGNRTFYKSVLTGDTSDNIPGLYKTTGQKCVTKIKNGVYTYTSNKDLWAYVKGHYTGHEDTARLIAQLLWIAHPEEIYWSEP